LIALDSKSPNIGRLRSNLRGNANVVCESLKQ